MISIMQKYSPISPSALNGKIFLTQIFCPEFYEDMATFTEFVKFCFSLESFPIMIVM